MHIYSIILFCSFLDNIDFILKSNCDKSTSFVKNDLKIFSVITPILVLNLIFSDSNNSSNVLFCTIKNSFVNLSLKELPYIKSKITISISLVVIFFTDEPYKIAVSTKSNLLNSSLIF